MTKFAVAASVVALLLSGGANASVQDDVAWINRGLTLAASNGLIFYEDAATDREIAARAAEVAGHLPPDRERHLRAVLHEVALHWRVYDAPRDAALFGMLAENTTYFGSHAVPPPRTDAVGPDGVVYRLFPGLGLQWHPLAEFGTLNAVVASRDVSRTLKLAQALVERGEDTDGLRFEYYFPFGGPTPWVSGMAQAVGAQALARAAQLTGDATLADSAAGAFQVVRQQLLTLSSGPWIRLYSFGGEVVLNAQLQTILSLQDYAALTGDSRAASLAGALDASAKALFERFDTGAWSLYSLGGPEASLDYQRFVTALLQKLGDRDPAWSPAAARFKTYLKQTPTLAVEAQSTESWPRPRDGYLDDIAVTFRLSKISHLTLSVGTRQVSATVGRGPHTFHLDPGSLPPGQYAARLAATDFAGNASSVDLTPVNVGWDTSAPNVAALIQGTTLNWSSDDAGTPWLDLRVVLKQGATTSVRKLGRRPTSGSLLLAPPEGTWDATLLAKNSAGYTATVPLGPFPAPG